MKKKIFVGNLAWKTSEDDLRQLFEAHGAVLSVKIVLDQYTGKSKGFGFVEMDSDEAAQSAIAALDNKEFHERNLRVSLAQERPQEGGRGGSGGGGGGGGGGFRRSGPSRGGERGGERSYRGHGG
jgi:cold-inducible RNA-binding protein